MNSKKGGSLASNHVHRLLNKDCKKGGKRSRAKKSKSKTKKSKRRTKKPKLVKRKKRTRNKKTKKKMKGGDGLFGSKKKPKKPKCNGNDIEINNLDDFIEQKESLITCSEELIFYLKEKIQEFDENGIFTNADDYEKLESLMDFLFIAVVCYSLIFIDMDVIEDQTNELYKEYIKSKYNVLKKLINNKRKIIQSDTQYTNKTEKDGEEMLVFGNHAINILLYILPIIVYGSKKNEIIYKYAQYCKKYYEALNYGIEQRKNKAKKIGTQLLGLHFKLFNKIKERFIELKIIKEE